MSVEQFLHAIPKVELNLQLEGSVLRETMLMFADQNEMNEQVKRFDKVLAQYQDPDFKKLDELTANLRSWIQYGEDLTRAVYDIGVSLSKENVRYAEIGINPLSFVTGDFTFDEFLAALNDGRDRAERGWGVQMRWVMLIPRDEPRYSDEIARWATSTTAKDGGVVALALYGYNASHVTLDQFERAFSTAEKKGLARIAYLDVADDFDEAINLLRLNTVIDAWGIVESPDTLSSLRDRDVTLMIGLRRAISYGWITTPEEYPLTTLLEHDVPLLFNSHMPTIFGSTLSEEYTLAHQHGLLDLDQIQKIILNTLNASYLPDEDKAVLLQAFEMDYDVIRETYLEEDV